MWYQSTGVAKLQHGQDRSGRVQLGELILYLAIMARLRERWGMQLAPRQSRTLQLSNYSNRRATTKEKADTGHKLMDTADGQAQVGHLGTCSLCVNVFIFYAVDN
jgi:hypothetical protein